MTAVERLGKRGIDWLDALGDYGRFVGFPNWSVTMEDGTVKPADRKTLLYPYLRQGETNKDSGGNQVWNCPANDRPEQEASYGFNTNFNWVKVVQILRSSEKVALCDAGLMDQPALAPSTSTHVWSPGRPSTTSSCRPNHIRHAKGLVTVVTASPAPARADVKAEFFYAEVTSARLRVLTEMFERGTITARVGSVVPLAQARRAHEMVDGAPHAPAKIMIEIR